ncbi:SpoIIE family protein phosphatase [Streptomyces melanosporofaciens]|uniref:Serine phosphatase RsbU, regulator of sigma subunit n=1 Tax=Streptomyces melanosporofaciens TaxID=67327 RepID=A0A1H4LDF7_STRMJ|nr:SpoIIE family protein phosphatase [Streptomyces melanosporofaciens]SEB68747.1 Serine phosphatase RsbU, regulator of sigma subunit [Streptomyces melanosporofaciens]
MGALFPLARESVSRTTLPGSVRAPGAARTFVRTALTGRSAAEAFAPVALDARSIDDAVLLVSELVTNAVLHAGTRVEVVCRLQPGDATADEGDTMGQPDEPSLPADAPRRPGIVVEVADLHPASTVYGGPETQRRGRGRGLQLIGALAESWGVTYQRTRKVVWCRLDAERAVPESNAVPTSALGRELRFAETLAPVTPREQRDPTADWVDRGGPSFLAEASELLTGQLDENMVAALAGQLLVPRLADWCAVWLTTPSGGLQLARVWHSDEHRIGALRLSLERHPPPTGLGSAGTSWPWPGIADSQGGSAVCFPLIAHGRSHGALLIGRAAVPRMAEGVVRLSEDVARRVAQAVATARQYTRQATISRALQRRQLPMSLAHIPGVDSAIVYEPHGEGQTVGGDFYDLFPMGDRRWCFLLGDVQGSDPEAMSVTGLARHLVRLLAREGHGVESVLNRLNQALVEEDAEAAEIDGEQSRPRFLSLLYGELEPDPEGGSARCTLASAGHPLPLRLTTDGAVAPAASPQMLLGIDENPDFHADTLDLAPGETLLCVTDGVTERRNGVRQLDDDDGLSDILRGCVGLGAKAVAERVRRATYDFSPEPIDDDLAVLVLEAVPTMEPPRVP